MNRTRIVPKSLPLREGRTQSSLEPAATSPPAITPDGANPAGQTDGWQKVPYCHNKAQLAERLNISLRSLSRAIAAGVVPDPDLLIGRSPRWTGRTIEAWLRSKPVLPGRGRGKHHA